MFKRTEESALTSWFFEVDRKLLTMVLIMIGIGMYFAVSAGSVAAERIGQSWYFFIVKGIPFYWDLVFCSVPVYQIKNGF